MPKDNLTTASVPLTLDGRDFVLRYRALAFIEYAEHCGGDLLSDIRELGQAAAAGAPNVGQIFRKTADALWAGLVDLQPEIRREEVARMFSLADMPAVLNAMTHALMVGMPAQAEPPRPTPATEPPRDSLSTNGTDSGRTSESVAVSPLPNFLG